MAISVEKAVIAKLTKSNEKFEILVDPEKALEMKSGKDVSLEDLLATQEVYEDARKGLRIPSEKINKIFGTNDFNTVVKKIMKEGEIQLTTEQRKKMLEDKTKLIANIISKRGANPQTGIPHPADRIMRAMEQAKVRVDLEKGVEEQIESVLKSIQSIIPIKLEKAKIAIKVPPEFAGKASSLIRNFGSLIKEEWRSDGAYIALIEIPSGIQTEIYDKINSLTHGQAEVKIVGRE